MGVDGNSRAFALVKAPQIFGNNTICLVPTEKKERIYVDTGEFDDVKVSYTLNGVTHIQPLKNNL